MVLISITKNLGIKQKEDYNKYQKEYMKMYNSSCKCGKNVAKGNRNRHLETTSHKEILPEFKY
jgi:PHP family Zn ribbon phosphoesterase